MFARIFQRTKRIPDDHTKKQDGTSYHSASAREWGHIHKTPSIKTTTMGDMVVSAVVEIVSCANLDASLAKVASDGSGLVDPYVKVKFAKPFKNTHHHHRKNTSTASAASVVVAALPSSPSKGSMRNLVGITTTEEVGTDIHKTKAVKQTNNPYFLSKDTNAGFCIDGLSVKEFYDCQGLFFKVKSGRRASSASLAGSTSDELGSVQVSPHEILKEVTESSISEDGNNITMTFELMHPIKMRPGPAGSITIRCRPATQKDVLSYQQMGCGYFREYAEVPPTTKATTATNPKDGGIPGTVGVAASASVGEESLDTQNETYTVCTSAPNTPTRPRSVANNGEAATATTTSATITALSKATEAAAATAATTAATREAAEAASETRNDTVTEDPYNEDEAAEAHTNTGCWEDCRSGCVIS